MTHFKLFGAALILSMAFATPSFAQVNLPGDYSFFSPKDDFGPAVQAVQPARGVNVGGLRVPARSHDYIHHIRAHWTLVTRHWHSVVVSSRGKLYTEYCIRQLTDIAWSRDAAVPVDWLGEQTPLKISILSVADVSSMYAATLMERGLEITFGPFGYVPGAMQGMIDDRIDGVLILTDDENLQEIASASRGRPAAPYGATWLKSRDDNLRERLHHTVRRRMLAVLHLDPVLRRSGLIRTVAALRHQTL